MLRNSVKQGSGVKVATSKAAPKVHVSHSSGMSTVRAQMITDGHIQPADEQELATAELIMQSERGKRLQSA